jgi:hypothetical protein
MKTLHQTNRAKTYEAFMLVHSAPDTLATIYIERETEHFVYYVGGKADRKRSPSGRSAPICRRSRPCRPSTKAAWPTSAPMTSSAPVEPIF